MTWRHRAAVVLFLVLGTGLASAGRPWPKLVRTFHSAVAGPAASFELDEDGRTWQGVPGDVIPGTPWLVRAIHFLPTGVVLSDISRTSACAVGPRQSPWYQPRVRVLGDTAEISRPAAAPEAPPGQGTADWYAELAREYRFNERYSEADVVAARAAQLGSKASTQPHAVTFKPPDAGAPAAGTFRVNRVDDSPPPAPASASPSGDPGEPPAVP